MDFSQQQASLTKLQAEGLALDRAASKVEHSLIGMSAPDLAVGRTQVHVQPGLWRCIHAHAEIHALVAFLLPR